MSITSVVNDLVTSVSVINALKPLPPTISGYSVGGVDDTALDPAGGQTVQINGTGFLPGATITFDGSAVAVVTYVSPNQLTFTSPAKSAGTYTIYVVNSDGGTAIYIPGIIYSVLPTWTTGAGTLGSYYETQSISNTVVASGDAPITYSLYSGSLPTGASLAANGVITGTAPVDSSSTTYSFTIQATDAQLQDSTRSFSLTINTDVVTWVSPANATTYSSAVDSAIANVTLDATDAAGYAVTYSANALPTGLSLSGANISGTPTVIADSSTLLTATAATTNRTATRTINWSITVANDPYFEYNTLLIPGASTTFVDDASTNNFAVSIFGDTKPNSFNPYTPGYYSLYSPNTSANGLELASQAWTTYTGQFTIEVWVYYNSAPSAGWGIGGSSGGTFIPFYYNGTNYGPNIYGSGNIFTSSAAPVVGRWFHLAVTRNASNLMTFWFNGVSAGSATTSATFTQGIFNINPAGAGYLSNLRVVTGSCLYTTSFTPSTTPLTAVSGTQLLTCQSARFIDNSTNGYSFTTVNSPQISSFDPFTPNSSYSTYGSGYFDGTGDYLSVPASSALSFAADFTIECWVNTSTISLDPYGRRLWSFGSGAAFYLDALFYDGGAITSNLCIQIASTGIVITGTIPVANGQWNHVALTRSGSSMKLFVNGVQSGSTYTNSSAFTAGASNGMFLGCLGVGVGGFLLGNITDFRVLNGTAAYTTAFTPPSAPLTAISNTSLLTLQNNQPVNNSVFLDNSTNNFLVTRAGNATQGTFSPYGGNWSNYFGGQMVSTLSPSSTNFNLTGDFTLEAYVFLTALPGGDWGILDARTAGASPTSWLFGFNGSGKMQYYDGTARVGATTITLNTWHHVSWVRNGSVLRAYLNGVLDYYNGSYGTSAISPGSTAPVIGTKDYGIGAAWGTTGYISNLRVVNGTAVYTTSSTTVGTTIFTPSTTPLTPIANTTLLTCADSRFIDDSLNNYTITPSSSTISAQRFSPFNPSSVTPTSYSGYFDGTGDYLTVPSNSAFAFGTGDFTIECWVNTPLVHAYNDVIIELRSTESTSTGFVFNMNPTGIGYQLNFYTDGGFNLGSTVLNYNVWNHCAVTRSGTTVRLFSNGVLNGTFTKANNFSDTPVPHIGVSPLYSPSDVIGYFSNLRVIKGTALYTSNFTPSTTPLTTTSQGATASQVSLLTLQSPTFIDNSTNNFTITAFGNSQPTQQNPFGFTSTTTNGYTPSTIGGSGYFDGTGDYLTVPSNSALNFGTGDFTVEAWVNLTGVVTDSFIISATGAGGFFFGWNNTVGGFGWGRNGIAWDYQPTGTTRLNQWQHVAVSRSGTSMRLFVNGSQVGTTQTNSTSYDMSLTSTTIGSQGTSYYWTGYITNLRAVKGTAVYTSNFTPPAQPLTAVQNTVLLTNMTSAGIYDAAMMNNMETVGDAKLSTAVSKFGGSSMYFDGTGDHLYIPNAPVNQLGTGNYTIEFWIYGNSWSTLPVILEYGRSTNNASAGLEFYVSTGGGKLDIYGGASTATLLASYSSLSTTTWTHIALTRASTTTRLFINGTQSGSSATDSTNYNQSSILVGIFIGSTNPLNGYIDDLRITKGYARYTSNFTPPTSAFQLF